MSLRLPGVRTRLTDLAEQAGLGGEDGPVVGERQVGQVVVPDRVVQAQALVAVPPLQTGWIAGT